MDEKDFSFIQETIKDEKLNQKAKGKRLVSIAVLGIVFGICASISFSAIKPWADHTFGRNKTKVEIPDDNEEGNESDSQAEEESSIKKNKVTQEDIEKINDKLYGIGQKATRGMAVITNVPEGQNWIQASKNGQNKLAGLIVANNGQELLILVSTDVIEEKAAYMATFTDGSDYEADLKVKDNHFGYAIMGVDIDHVKESTKNKIKIASLGNSNELRSGDVVIAIGSQFGYKDDLGYGIVSSIENTVNEMDGVFNLITTDIPCAERGSGVLINMDGKVIGLINGKLSKADNPNISNAYAISRVKSMIELLLNGYEIPYMGVYGTDVTEQVSKEQNLPKGIYVTDIETGSAAMEAGIKSGDVIDSVNGQHVQNLKEYHNSLMKCKVGDKIKVHGQRRGSDGYVEITFTVTLTSQ